MSAHAANVKPRVVARVPPTHSRLAEGMRLSEPRSRDVDLFPSVACAFFPLVHRGREA
jgi:hypothetical protein